MKGGTEHMGLLGRRLAATLVALTLMAIIVAWWLASVLAVAFEEVVPPEVTMSESGGAQSA